MTFGTGVLFGVICGVFFVTGLIALVATVGALVDKIKELVEE